MNFYACLYGGHKSCPFPRPVAARSQRLFNETAKKQQTAKLRSSLLPSHLMARQINQTRLSRSHEQLHLIIGWFGQAYKSARFVSQQLQQHITCCASARDKNVNGALIPAPQMYLSLYVSVQLCHPILCKMNTLPKGLVLSEGYISNMDG